jgi:hypothetical protein
MRTENDIRDAFAAEADDMPSAADVLSRLSLTEPHARSRRRLVPALAAAAAIVAIGAAAVATTPLELQRHSPAGVPDGTAPPPRSVRVCSPSPQDLTIFRIDPAPGLRYADGGLVDCGRRSTTVWAIDGKTIGNLTVYDAGAYDPTMTRAGRPVQIAGHPGFVGHLATSAIGDQPELPASGVAWEYRPGAWATLSGVDGGVDRRMPLIQRLATALHPDARDPLLVPMRLRHLPAGVELAFGSSSHTTGALFDFQPVRYEPDPRCPAAPNRFSSCAPGLIVQLDRATGPGLDGVPGQRIQVAGHEARLQSAPLMPPGQTRLVVLEGPWTVTVSVRGPSLHLPEQQLIQIAAGVVPAASLTDQSTWFDARTALP